VQSAAKSLEKYFAALRKRIQNYLAASAEI
jgi:hypothetical protein